MCGKLVFFYLLFFAFACQKKRGKQQEDDKNISAIADSDADTLFFGKRSGGGPSNFGKQEWGLHYYLPLYCMYLWSGKNGRGKNCPFFFFFFFRLTLKTVKQYQASGDTGFDVRCEVWDWKTCHYTSQVFLVHLSCNFTFCTYHNNSYMFAKCPSNGS